MPRSKDLNLPYILAFIMIPCATQFDAVNGQEADRTATLTHALKLAADGDTFQAFDFLESRYRPPQVVELYSQLVRRIYAEKKDIPLMLAFGRQGISVALRDARRLEADDRETSQLLLGTAKSIAYNLGSNTWPGWDEPGIVLTRSDIAFGVDAAVLNLRLGKELRRGPEAMGNAYWLIGAHHLSGRRTAPALEAFTAANVEFARADKPDYVLMTAGYLALTRRLAEETREAGTVELQRALAELQQSPSDDAKFFAEQIQTAERALLRQFAIEAGDKPLQ